MISSHILTIIITAGSFTVKKPPSELLATSTEVIFILCKINYNFLLDINMYRTYPYTLVYITPPLWLFYSRILFNFSIHSILHCFLLLFLFRFTNIIIILFPCFFIYLCGYVCLVCQGCTNTTFSPWITKSDTSWLVQSSPVEIGWNNGENSFLLPQKPAVFER